MYRTLLPTLFSLLLCQASKADPMILTLDQQGSQVQFLFRSKLVSTQGEFTDYHGRLLLDQNDLTRSSLEITANPSKVTLPSLPLEQRFLIQGLINSIPASTVSFMSDSFEKTGGTSAIILGTTVVANKREKVRLPVTILQNGTTRTLKGVYERTGLIGNVKNPTSQLFGESTCKADFSLLFKR